jgi:hydrogenase maturation protease
MRKNILILCCGYMYGCDNAFGYHVFKILEKMKLPDNVDIMEVGFSACMIPHVIDTMDKVIIVDVFDAQSEPGTILRIKAEELHLFIEVHKDPAKAHLMDTLDDIKLTGDLPETIFLGVVPLDFKTQSEQLTPEIEKKLPEVIDMILKEVSA